MKILALLFIISIFFSGQANAVATPGQDWQINFFDAASPVMEKIYLFHSDILLPIITVITLFVLALLIYVSVRFRKSKNPVPSKTTHHVGIEILWTIVPILILVVIAIPSIRLLIMQDETPKSDITIKAIGYQWYWGYEYPQEGVAEYASYMRCLPENGIYKKECLQALNQEKVPHKLAVDYPIVVPLDKTVRVLVTAMDVIHAFALPALGVKKDAVPGRMNQTWFKATKLGTYYGQCSELCGVNHAFMPITLEVVPQNIYDKWLTFAKAGKLDEGNKFINDYKNTIVQSNQDLPYKTTFEISYKVNNVEVNQIVQENIFQSNDLTVNNKNLKQDKQTTQGNAQ
jgi:cytochrome c oxidase subunit 2